MKTDLLHHKLNNCGKKYLLVLVFFIFLSSITVAENPTTDTGVDQPGSTAPTDYPKDPAAQAAYLATNYNPELAFQFYQDPAHVGLNTQLDQKYFGDQNNIGKNTDSDDAFFSGNYKEGNSKNNFQNNPQSGAVYLTKKYGASYAIEAQQLAEDFVFNPTKGTLLYHGKTLTFSEYTNDQSIAKIVIINDGIKIIRNDEDKISTSVIEIKGDGVQQIVNNPGSGIHFVDGSGQVQRFKFSGDVGITFQNDGGLQVLGVISGTIPFDRSTAQFSNHRGTLILGADGSISADNAQVITPSLYADGHFSKKGSTIIAQDHADRDIGNVDSDGRTFIIDRITGVGVKTQGQVGQEKVTVNFNKIASSSQFAPKTEASAAEPTPSADPREKLQQQIHQLQQAQGDLGGNAEVWIKKDLASNHVIVTAKGKVDVGLYETPNGGGISSKNGASHFIGETGKSEFDSRIGTDSEINVRGKATYDDKEYPHIRSKEDGASYKIIRPSGVSRDIFSADCFTCSPDKSAIDIQKQIVLLTPSSVESVFVEGEKKTITVSLKSTANGLQYAPSAVDLGAIAQTQADKTVALGRDLVMSISCAAEKRCNFALGIDEQRKVKGFYEEYDSGKKEIIKKTAFDLSLPGTVGDTVVITSEKNKQALNSLVDLIKQKKFNLADVSNAKLSFDADPVLRLHLQKTIGVDINLLNKEDYLSHLVKIVQLREQAQDRITKLRSAGLNIDDLGRPLDEKTAKIIARLPKIQDQRFFDYTAAKIDLAKATLETDKALRKSCEEGQTCTKITPQELQQTKRELQQYAHLRKQVSAEAATRKAIQRGILPEGGEVDRGSVVKTTKAREEVTKSIQDLRVSEELVNAELTKLNAPNAEPDYDRKIKLENNLKVLKLSRVALESVRTTLDQQYAFVVQKYVAKGRPDFAAELALTAGDLDTAEELTTIVQKVAPKQGSVLADRVDDRRKDQDFEEGVATADFETRAKAITDTYVNEYKDQASDHQLEQVSYFLRRGDLATAAKIANSIDPNAGANAKANAIDAHLWVNAALKRQIEDYDEEQQTLVDDKRNEKVEQYQGFLGTLSYAGKKLSLVNLYQLAPGEQPSVIELHDKINADSQRHLQATADETRLLRIVVTSLLDRGYGAQEVMDAIASGKMTREKLLEGTEGIERQGLAKFYDQTGGQMLQNTATFSNWRTSVSGRLLSEDHLASAAFEKIQQKEIFHNGKTALVEDQYTRLIQEHPFTQAAAIATTKVQELDKTGTGTFVSDRILDKYGDIALESTTIIDVLPFGALAKGTERAIHVATAGKAAVSLEKVTTAAKIAIYAPEVTRETLTGGKSALEIASAAAKGDEAALAVIRQADLAKKAGVNTVNVKIFANGEARELEKAIVQTKKEISGALEAGDMVKAEEAASALEKLETGQSALAAAGRNANSWVSKAADALTKPRGLTKNAEEAAAAFADVQKARLEYHVVKKAEGLTAKGMVLQQPEVVADLLNANTKYQQIVAGSAKSIVEGVKEGATILPKELAVVGSSKGIIIDDEYRAALDVLEESKLQAKGETAAVLPPTNSHTVTPPPPLIKAEVKANLPGEISPPWGNYPPPWSIEGQLNPAINPFTPKAPGYILPDEFKSYPQWYAESIYGKVPHAEITGEIAVKGKGTIEEGVGSAASVFNGKIEGVSKEVAIKMYATPTYVTPEFDDIRIAAEALHKEAEVSRDLSKILPTPRYYGIVDTGANPSMAVEKFVGEVFTGATEKTDLQIASLLTDEALAQLKSGLLKAEKAGWGTQDVNFVVLTKDQLLNGRQYQKGDVIFFDFGGWGKSSKFEDPNFAKPTNRYAFFEKQALQAREALGTAKPRVSSEYVLEDIVQHWEDRGLFNPGGLQSNPLQRYRNPVSGKEVLIKGGQEHTTQADYIGQQLFAEVGLPVPKTSLAMQNGKLVQVIEYIPDSKTSMAITDVLQNNKDLQQGLFMDALINNYDRYGNNVLYREVDGTFLFIDQGGSLGSTAGGEFRGFADTMTSRGLREIIYPRYAGQKNQAYLNVLDVAEDGKVIIKNPRAVENGINQLRSIKDKDIEDIVGRTYAHLSPTEQKEMILQRIQYLKGKTDQRSIDALSDAQRILKEFDGNEALYVEHALKSRRDSLVTMLDNALTVKLKSAREIHFGENIHFDINSWIKTERGQRYLQTKEGKEWFNANKQDGFFSNLVGQPKIDVVKLGDNPHNYPRDFIRYIEEENNLELKLGERMYRYDTTERTWRTGDVASNSLNPDLTTGVVRGSQAGLDEIVALEAARLNTPNNLVEIAVKDNFLSLATAKEGVGAAVAPRDIERHVFDLIESVGDGRSLTRENIKELLLNRARGEVTAGRMTNHEFYNMERDFEMLFDRSSSATKDIATFSKILSEQTLGFTNVHLMRDGTILGASDSFFQKLKGAENPDVRIIYVSRDSTLSPTDMTALHEGKIQLSNAKYSGQSNEVKPLMESAAKESSTFLEFKQRFQTKFNKMMETDSDFRQTAERTFQYLVNSGLVKDGAKLRFIDTCCTGSINYFLEGTVRYYRPDIEMQSFLMDSSLLGAGKNSLSAGLNGHSVETLVKPGSFSGYFDVNDVSPLLKPAKSGDMIGDEGLYYKIENKYGETAEQTLSFLDELVVLQQTAAVVH